ncbi:S8 family peptidase [Cohnella candidum]|uniref:S8 family peptidase n=1 Tax=Cohnella candidum TaxID=2674991 RepID=UPI001F152356|nr:S8 family peptidase [Cohnella candidum]
MRNKTWIGTAGVVLAIAAGLLLFPRNHGPGRTAEPPVPQSSPLAAARESHYKELTVRQDMEATERLGRMQSIRDARQFAIRVSRSQTASAKPDQALLGYLREHPELAGAAWIAGPGGKDRTAGTAVSGMQSSGDAHWKSARSAVLGGQSYSSPAFSVNGHAYFIIGEPSPARKGQGVIALVSASAVQEVERHQRRNLRLIPFPAEGRYRTESVLPNTTKDITVRKGEDNGNASHYSVDEVVVKFRKPLQPKELLRLRKDLDLTVVRQTRQTYVFRSRKHRAEPLMEYFKKFDPVYVEPHYLYLTNELDGETDPQPIVPNDTLYSRYQWNLPQIDTEQGWNVNRGSQVIVAVVDTGVQSDHPDLQGKLVPGVNIVDSSKPPEDDVGHGTHVAGIIAAQINNHEGVAGLTWYTKIMPVKALDSSGAGSTYSVAEGVIWAADHGANVINMSLGNYAQAQFLHDAIRYANNKGVLVVAASGNDNTDRPGYPAAYPEVVAVSATDPGGGKAEYSNFGDYIDVAAPGTSIASTYPGSRYASLSGTSMASPHVAALASLIRGANPQLSNAEVANVLRSTAVDLGDKGKDKYYGYGQIDIRNALRSVGGQASSLQMYPDQVRRELESIGIR